MKDRTAFTSLGGFQFLMASNLVGSILMDSAETRRPRYSTSLASKEHFESLRASRCSQRRCRTCLVRSWCKTRSSLEWMSMSSI